jgi:mannose-6-phosphate isomerase-like protein (cupin superfamily)
MTQPMPTRPHPTHHWNGARYQTLLSSAETGGALSILHVDTPALSGPPSHVHAAEDEVFVLLDGSIDFQVGEDRFTCGPMQTAYVPRGVVHSFRTGPQGARGLSVMTPGGFEGFFAEMAQSGLHLPQDLAAVRAIAARYGSRFTGPGLAHIGEGRHA